jgi:uncharacterized membrane protein
MKTQTILNLFYVLAWVICIGLLIQSGALLTSYAVSFYNPDAAKNLYMGLDLFTYKEYSVAHYSIIVILKAFLLCMQAYVAYLFAELVKDFDLAKPFNDKIVQLMERICFAILFIWIMTLLHNAYFKALEKLAELPANYIDGSFLIWSAMVYVIAQVFKRGIELQSENEFTI